MSAAPSVSSTPRMVTSSLTSISPAVRVMVLPAISPEKMIVSAPEVAFARSTASRSDRSPAS